MAPSALWDAIMAKNYYDTLGIKKEASADEIKQAYRKMSKELHPDKHKGEKEAENKFKEVNEAYEVLSNPQKKQMYDQFGSADMNGAGGFGGGTGSGGFDFSGFQNGDAVNFGDLFESFFGGAGGARGRRTEKGDDREVALTISFKETVTGSKKTIRIRKLGPCSHCSGSGAEPGSQVITCPDCSGTGQIVRTAQSFFGTVQQRVVCPRCGGSGKTPERACTKCEGEGRRAEDIDVTVDIPAGIDDGQTLRVRGEADAGRRGAPAGDLYVRIRVTPDERFEREGPDIRSSISIPVVDAVLGTEVEVQTVHEPITLKIPAGTQPDQVFRLKSKGIPVLSTSRYGDHYVTVHVEVPTKLSRKEKELLEEWKKLQ